MSNGAPICSAATSGEPADAATTGVGGLSGTVIVGGAVAVVVGVVVDSVVVVVVDSVVVVEAAVVGG